MWIINLHKGLIDIRYVQAYARPVLDLYGILYIGKCSVAFLFQNSCFFRPFFKNIFDKTASNRSIYNSWQMLSNQNNRRKSTVANLDEQSNSIWVHLERGDEQLQRQEHRERERVRELGLTFIELYGWIFRVENNGRTKNSFKTPLRWGMAASPCHILTQ